MVILCLETYWICIIDLFYQATKKANCLRVRNQETDDFKGIVQ